MVSDHHPLAHDLVLGYGLKAFQPLVEYPIFLYRGFTIGDFTKCHPIPQNALQQTFCNHYRRAAPNMNIFNFFHYRIGLDGRNFQIGALGTLGIDVGTVSGGWGGAL